MDTKRSEQYEKQRLEHFSSKNDEYFAQAELNELNAFTVAYRRFESDDVEVCHWVILQYIGELFKRWDRGNKLEWHKGILKNLGMNAK